MPKCSKGYTEKSGECVKSKKHKSSSRKSYNPFKMLGSWVGAGMPLLLSFNLNPFKCIPIYTLGGWGNTACSNEVFWKLMLFLIPLSFLLGYGIHSLIRRFKK